MGGSQASLPGDAPEKTQAAKDDRTIPKRRFHTLVIQNEGEEELIGNSILQIRNWFLIAIERKVVRGRGH
jgi:hypothetical protein